ncbi:MAG: STAS/SEC14 domain-containing protein [Amylibacter sp.]|nr:STAS/SEC14 domain-containing protein [Amylibacter sp.]
MTTPKTLIPLIEEKIRTQGQVKLLYWCGAEFESFTAGAMWDDARFGLMHLGDVSKVAFVTDVEWLRMSMKLFSPLLRMPVQVFHNAEIGDAKQWILES